MSRDQLGEMLKQQEVLSRVGAKQGDSAKEQLRLGLEKYKNQKALAAAVGEEAYQNLMNASAQEKIAVFIEKITQSFADFVENSGIVGKIEQFVNFFSGLLRGEFGTSLTYNREVYDIIFTALPTSLWLVLLNSIIIWAIVIPLALFVATSKSVIVAYVFRSSTAFSIALPNFFVALLL